MRKILICFFLGFSLVSHAQWKDGGTKITTNQNVGIGTDTPQYLLDVFGNARFRHVFLYQGSMITPYPSDKFTYQGQNLGYYAIQWANDLWSNGANRLWMSAFGGIKLFTAGKNRLSINSDGNIGVGIEDPKNKFEVNGKLRAEEVIIETGWADFVFNEGYKLRSLYDVKAHIDKYKHLPDIPSEAEVKENGVSLGEMQSKLLQKIEELTLYMIKQEEKNKALEKEVQEFKAKLEKL